jgi:RNA polymerase sigma-54 factor
MLIIGNLDPDGYFRMPAVEGEADDSAVRDPLVRVAYEAGVGIEFAQHVLTKVQSLDPPGVAARDLRECLLLQAKHLNADLPEVVAILEHHLKHLESKNYAAISRDLKIPVEQVIKAVKVISAFEPKPGRAYTSEEAQYITPDVTVQKVGDRYVTMLNDDGLSKLRISGMYRQALKNGSAGAAKEYIQDKLRSAVWLIRSIHQRQRTIFKVTESIVKFQKDFFDKGIAYLKPLILRDVAEDIGMHESTVSRVTTNKYVHTPQGIYELKFFFNSAIARTGGDEIASEAVKNHIRQIVAAEDPKRPHSDQKIVELLKGQNIEIARRTVAKYREVLGILPSSKRKKFF